MNLFLDTNIFLHSLDKIDVDNNNISLSGITIQELENIKSSNTKTEELRYEARRAVRFINRNLDKLNVIIHTDYIDDLITKQLLPITNDNIIIASAYKLQKKCEDIVFVTDDSLCAITASTVFGLNVEIDKEETQDIYKGYKKIVGTSEEITKFIANTTFVPNEYLIIENTETGESSEMRFDGSDFVNLKLPPSKYIKGKNALQRCAIDMLNNPNITICAVLGTYGSGKTALTMKMAVYHVREKGNQSFINLIRNPIGEGVQVGYLKGDFEEKTEQFFLPLVQQLDGGEFELESMKRNGIVDATIPYYCKGLTFNNSVVVVDEAEDLDEKEIKLIGTRLGENSRVFLNGDYKQSVRNVSKNNALIRTCNALKGNNMFACIYLDSDVRSETSKIFANLFEN